MSKYLAIGLIFLLCLSSVESALTAKTTAYPATQCAGGTHTPTLSRFTSAAPITTAPPQINGVSYTRVGSTDALNEAIEIRYALTGAVGAWVLTFTFMKSDGTTFTRTAPALADTPVLLLAQRNIFVFQMGTGVSATRKAYRVNTGATGNIADSDGNDIFVLGTPTNAIATAASVTAFKALSANLNTAGTTATIACYVEGDLSGGSLYGNFINYVITFGGTTVFNTIRNPNYAASPLKLTVPFTTYNTLGFHSDLFFDRSETTESGVVSYVNGVFTKAPAAFVDVGNKATV